MLDWLPDDVAAMDATRTLLALALVPDRLCLYAAVSYTKLLDQPIAAARDAATSPAPPVIAIKLSDTGHMLAWADSAGNVRVFSFGGTMGAQAHTLLALGSLQLSTPAAA